MLSRGNTHSRGDQDPYAREHPEYRDENGYRRNRECSYR